MSDSWLDHIPSAERQRIRERFRLSESAYEALREKVKGPRELAEEMARNEQVAELKFALETQPKIKDALKQRVERDLREQGTQAMLGELAPDVRSSIERGTFDIRIETNPETQQDQLAVVPEGNVSDALPLPFALNEQYVAQFMQAL